MKRAIYIILLLLYTTLVHAYMYQSNMPTYQPQTKIGYTTNYSNGQFTPSAYQNLNTSTYSGTYNPYSNWDANNEGSGRPGQPRRVKGYTDDGEEHDDGGSPYSDWAPLFGTSHFEGQSGVYYWDDETNSWWRYDGSKWHKWMSTLDYYHWSIFEYGGPSNPEQGYNKDKPTPIGDTTTPLLILMFAYLSCQQIKKRR